MTIDLNVEEAKKDAAAQHALIKRLAELEKENEQLKEETARQSKRIIELLSYIGEA